MTDDRQTEQFVAACVQVEVVQYLDQVVGQQQQKNPKHVNRLKDEAIKQAERNIRRYEKLQEEAAKRAQKEQKKLASTITWDQRILLLLTRSRRRKKDDDDDEQQQQ